MTIPEARYKFGTPSIKAHLGDTLRSIVRRIYHSDDEIYYKIIKRLNVRFDWFNVEAGATIYYFDKTAVSQITEL